LNLAPPPRGAFSAHSGYALVRLHQLLYIVFTMREASAKANAVMIALDRMGPEGEPPPA